MKIKKIVSQSRRDFRAIYVCEHCDWEEEGEGYDDAYFHSEVIPKMVCKRCKAVAGADYRGIATRYPEGMDL